MLFETIYNTILAEAILNDFHHTKKNTRLAKELKHKGLRKHVRDLLIHAMNDKDMDWTNTLSNEIINITNKHHNKINRITTEAFENERRAFPRAKICCMMILARDIKSDKHQNSRELLGEIFLMNDWKCGPSEPLRSELKNETQ